jgi:hypothetical protein
VDILSWFPSDALSSASSATEGAIKGSAHETLAGFAAQDSLWRCACVARRSEDRAHPLELELASIGGDDERAYQFHP